MYKLRAKADIQDRSAAYRVFAGWGPAPSRVGEAGETHFFPDPRLGALGWRGLTGARLVSGIASAIGGLDASPEDYHAYRIALGVPEGGKDYAFGEAFPHEADLDQLNGVSFGKGCFVGQEVVSRMHNRASARKRVVPIAGEAPLTPGAEVKAGAAVIGSVGSVAGAQALALVRLDRAAEAVAKGERLVAGGVAITLRKPEWATFELAPAATVGAS
jgi:folate-binding protein YgfZ